MFRCFLPPSRSSSIPTWLFSHTNTSSGSRGIKPAQLIHTSAAIPRSSTGGDKVRGPEGPGLRLGNYWTSLLRKNEIGLPHNNVTIKYLSKHKITIRASPRHNRKAVDDPSFTQNPNGYVEVIVREYLRAHREKPLWIMWNVFPVPKPIVRGRCRVRLISAWRQALRNLGYDPHGKRLPPGDGTEKGRDLFGTVEFWVPLPLEVMDVPFETLREYFEGVVRSLADEFSEAARDPLYVLGSGPFGGAYVSIGCMASTHGCRDIVGAPTSRLKPSSITNPHQAGDNTAHLAFTAAFDSYANILIFIPPRDLKDQFNTTERLAIQALDTMLVSLTVGKVDAGVTVLLTPDKRLIEFPSILLPPDISSGSIVDITVARNTTKEAAAEKRFQGLQDQIYNAFGAALPTTPILRCRNATQTSVVLEWDPIQLATADLISLSLYRNGQKAGIIPKPLQMHTTKISGLAVDTKYVFHLVLRTTAGTYTSEKVEVQTHKMTDLSGITITTGILPHSMRENLGVAVERIGAKIVDTVRIDTTHFVTTEGRGIQWEKAVEMNIPVVRPEWVDACEKSGRILGVTKFYLDALRPGPPNEDQSSPHLPQHQRNESSSAPAPPAKDKDLPAAPSGQNQNGGESRPERTPDKVAKFTEDDGARQKEEGVSGDEKAESSDEEGNKAVETEEKTVAGTDDEPKSRFEDKEHHLTLRPKATTVEDVEEEKVSTPASASRGSFQDVQL